MKTEPYIPQPIDTNDVALPHHLDALAEALAKNVHEVWAQTRISQGWTYGEQRDDAKKQHPCMVPYEQLPDEEKVYDRNTSQATLKLIMKLGFDIVRRQQ
ncbi:MAG: RyR domain-containing protein [Muribaculaceae bacterium]